MKRNDLSIQEKLWAEGYGKKYIERSDDGRFLKSRLATLSKILKTAKPIRSVLEIGANVGQTLEAMTILFPEAKLHAMDICPHACKRLQELSYVEKVIEESIVQAKVDQTYDLVITCGTLILIPEESLPAVYNNIFEMSNKYIAIMEPYSPTPLKVNYHGHEGVMCKRDFAGEMMDSFTELSLENYGFNYSRDNFTQADLNWFLLRKNKINF